MEFYLIINFNGVLMFSFFSSNPSQKQSLLARSSLGSTVNSSKKKIVNSLISSQSELAKFNGPAITASDQRLTRNAFFTLATLGLVGNIGAALFRYEVAYQGLIKIGCPTDSSKFLAIIGASLDFFATIGSVSPMNNTNTSIFSSATHLSSKTLWLKQLTFAIACLTAYPLGGSVGLLGILPYLTPFDNNTFFTVSIVAAIFIIIPGMFNFISFNLSSEAKSFSALEHYFKAVKTDHHIGRDLQIIIECLFIIVYRALSHAAIAVSIAPSLRLPISNIQQLIFAMIIFSGTCINIIATRLVKTVNQWSNNLFAYITPQEKNDALSSVHYAIYLDLNIASGIVMAIGLAMMVKSFNHFTKSNDWIAPAVILGGIVLTITVSATRSLVINNIAKGAVGEHELNMRKMTLNKNITDINQSNDDLTQPLLKEINTSLDGQEKIKAVNSAYTLLAETFIDIPGLQMFGIICSIGGRTARFAGFLHFTDVIVTLFGVEFTSESIIAIALAIAPPNLSNEYHMFKDGMTEVLTQKAAETYVTYCSSTRNTEAISEIPSFQDWIKHNKRFFFYPLYSKGALEYPAEDIAYALARRATDLGYSQGVILAPPNSIYR